MTRQDKIDELQDKVSKNYIKTIDDLKLEISCAEYDGDEPIDEVCDVLSPMGWSYCDRCEALGDVEMDFAWVDYMDYEEDKQILDAIAKEGEDYCSVCWKCCKELKKKGE